MFKMELDVSQLNNKKKPEHLILRYKGCRDPKVVFTNLGVFPKTVWLSNYAYKKEICWYFINMLIFYKYLMRILYGNIDYLLYEKLVGQLELI